MTRIETIWNKMCKVFKMHRFQSPGDFVASPVMSPCPQPLAVRLCLGRRARDVTKGFPFVFWVGTAQVPDSRKDEINVKILKKT